MKTIKQLLKSGVEISQMENDMLSHLDPKNLVFFCVMGSGKGWKILTDKNRKPFFDTEAAVKFIRAHKELKEWGTQITQLRFMTKDGDGLSVWDNF